MFLEYSAFISCILIKAVSLYYLIMCLFFWIPKKETAVYTPRTHFAVLTAARNEEAVIGDLIESIKAQDYPDELTEIYVIPNNCTDNTEHISKIHGAKTIRTKGVIRSKGDALHEAFQQLLSNEDIDAFVLFDSDNVADKDFLKAMDGAFQSGAEVAKSRIESKNPYSSWVSGCYGLYYNVFNRFFNESRSRLGLSPKLIGTGIAISRDLLIKMGGWNTVTIAEDTEFNADSVIEGADIRWVKDAVTFDETPDSFKISLKQRRRWIGGIMAVAKERVSDLFYEMRRTGPSLQLLDMMMILIMPFIQIVSVLPGLLLIAHSISSASSGMAIWGLAAGGVISYIGTMFFALLLAVLSPYSVKQIYRSILMFPVFTLSWLPLSFAALMNGEGRWEQIPHFRSAALLGRA